MLNFRLGFLISSTTDLSNFSSISQIKTFAPESKNLLAISKPKPWAPPVTTMKTLARFYIQKLTYFFM